MNSLHHTGYPTTAIRLQPRALAQELGTLSELLNSFADHLVNDDLGGLLLIDDSGDLAHEEGAGVVHGVVIKLVLLVEPLNVVLDGDDTLAGELPDLILALSLPVGDVSVVADTERATLINMLIPQPM